mmetsp:Transcript_17409/g.37584  ORF Transcript_17409/g.37584 Transcript_17409/m.37584 type:complete len:222 (-) Transcript_17409:912-1577(-)
MPSSSMLLSSFWSPPPVSPLPSSFLSSIPKPPVSTPLSSSSNELSGAVATRFSGVGLRRVLNRSSSPPSTFAPSLPPSEEESSSIINSHSLLDLSSSCPLVKPPLTLVFFIGPFFLNVSSLFFSAFFWGSPSLATEMIAQLSLLWAELLSAASPLLSESVLLVRSRFDIVQKRFCRGLASLLSPTFATALGECVAPPAAAIDAAEADGGGCCFLPCLCCCV